MDEMSLPDLLKKVDEESPTDFCEFIIEDEEEVIIECREFAPEDVVKEELEAKDSILLKIQKEILDKADKLRDQVHEIWDLQFEEMGIRKKPLPQKRKGKRKPKTKPELPPEIQEELKQMKKDRFKQARKVLWDQVRVLLDQYGAIQTVKEEIHFHITGEEVKETWKAKQKRRQEEE